MQLKHKKTGEIIDVLAITNNNGAVMATYWDSDLAAKRNGNGWNSAKINTFVPVDFDTSNIISKAERNRIKSRLELDYAEWRSTDGEIYTDIELAIAHEGELMLAEKASQEGNGHE